MTGLTTGTGLYGCLFCVYLATSCRPFLSVCWCCYVVFFSFLRFCFPSLLSRAYLCCVLFLMSFVFLCSFICLSFTSGFPSGVSVLSAIGRCNYPRVRRDADGTFPGLHRLIEVLFRGSGQKKTETILGVIFGLCKLINGKNIHIRYANPPPSPPPLDSEPSKDKRHFASAVRAIHGR